MALTDAKIRNTKPSTKPTKISDSHGLYLEVKPSGNKLWRYRYRIAGKENVFAAGEYVQSPDGETKEQAETRREAGQLTLAEARIERDKWRALVKQGIHPSHDRKQKLSAQITENGNTFKILATEWMEGAKTKKKWTPYYANQVERGLKCDVFPFVGGLPIRSISSAQMLGVLERIEKRGAHTVALLVRQWCSAVFRYAIGRRKADNDPMAALQGTIQRPEIQHNRPISQKEIPAFLRVLDEYGGHRTTVIALRLLMLTFVRTKELRMASWDEIDLEDSIWRIPAERMKMREPHIVPLSSQAVDLLKELHTLTGGQKWLFPNTRRPSDCMTGTTLNRALERMGYAGKFSCHGFRSTASTILNEMGYKPDVIEKQLAHADRNKVRAIYNQASYLQERKEMMAQWANFLDALKAGAKVIPLKRSEG